MLRYLFRYLLPAYLSDVIVCLLSEHLQSDADSDDQIGAKGIFIDNFMIVSQYICSRYTFVYNWFSQ